LFNEIQQKTRQLEQSKAELEQWNRTLEIRVAEAVAQLDRAARLKRFLSPHLAERILAGGADDPLASHRREICVVFLDLRGFTSFTEIADPEDVMLMLREYHEAMGRLVVEYEGTLERFTGDGMMVVFNDPTPVPDAAHRAAHMAIAMQHEFARLAEGWRRRGYDLQLGVGIGQGYATIGGIGFEGRLDYAAIGTVCNLAARLCAEAKGGEILIAQRVSGSLGSALASEPAGQLVLKGFHHAVPAWRLLAS
jgi:class 3 adenylate cyclase